jgi:hypothetical protein
MSRYVCHFSVNLSSQNVRSPLKKLLEACRMETIYELEDYLMAREIPGQVSFAKLVRVEILIDVSTTNPDAVKLSFVVKNEELPLNANNHCRQAFDLLRMAIDRYYHWQPVNSLQSPATSEAPHLDPNRFARSGGNHAEDTLRMCCTKQRGDVNDRIYTQHDDELGVERSS